ncbi:hypothetical protein HK097_010249 [Rhizophlyctis rosea]|uniref:Uncharacterized protein n=1 Tax=Rhizophlyctis rosea TaxID=64517 RepID=A0AAD5SA37_9FUNG|nr:hypothetical protein HK097_010249 [Rhizophlyctis rosea]
MPLQALALQYGDIKELSWGMFFPTEKDKGSERPGQEAGQEDATQGRDHGNATIKNEDPNQVVVANQLGRYVVAYRFHMTLHILVHNLAWFSGFGDHYPVIPTVPKDTFQVLHHFPAAKALLDQNEEMSNTLLKRLRNEDFGTQRAYIFRRRESCSSWMEIEEGIEPAPGDAFLLPHT